MPNSHLDLHVSGEGSPAHFQAGRIADDLADELDSVGREMRSTLAKRAAESAEQVRAKS